MKYQLGWGTHLPVLMNLVNKTTGPILELGMGLFSTPVLHWMCFDDKRELVSYDDDQKYYKMNKQFESDYHKIFIIDDWNKAKIERHWTIALVDHKPAHRRWEEVKRLVKYADYLILHDTQPEDDKWTKYHKVYNLFKYRYDYTKIKPWTSVLSNFRGLNSLF